MYPHNKFCKHFTNRGLVGTSQVFNCSYSTERSEKQKLGYLANRGALASQGIHGRAHGTRLLGRRIKVPRQAPGCRGPSPRGLFIGTFRVGRWWLPSAQMRVQLPTDLPPRGVKGLHGLGKTQVLKLIQH